MSAPSHATALEPAQLEVFGELAREGRAREARWQGQEDPELYGLVSRNGWLVPLAPFDPLREDAIRGHLSARAAGWLQGLEVQPVIGSTNAELMARAGSVSGHVCAAELQVAGRGRRGRSWYSPFGANLAISAGVTVARPPAEVAPVSLVVGLAVLDALEQLEVPGLSLKWPNDVLGGGAKLGGILVEMPRYGSARGPTELVVGIGINVSLPERVRRQLPPQVADLASLAPPPGRNLLAGRLLSALVAFVSEFEAQGFAPFRGVFDLRHAYHDCDCSIVHGGRVEHGRVRGVSGSGGLVLRTARGEEEFQAGDVSLRPRQAGLELEHRQDA